jgi:hypothetical protein
MEALLEIVRVLSLVFFVLQKHDRAWTMDAFSMYSVDNGYVRMIFRGQRMHSNVLKIPQVDDCQGRSKTPILLSYNDSPSNDIPLGMRNTSLGPTSLQRLQSPATK